MKWERILWFVHPIFLRDWVKSIIPVPSKKKKAVGHMCPIHLLQYGQPVLGMGMGPSHNSIGVMMDVKKISACRNAIITMTIPRSASRGKERAESGCIVLFIFGFAVYCRKLYFVVLLSYACDFDVSQGKKSADSYDCAEKLKMRLFICL